MLLLVALRHGRDRARPGRAAAARPRAAACSWAPGCGCRACGPREALAGAAAWCCRWAALPLPVAAALDGDAALVELPRLELVRRRQGGHLRLDPPVRPARLAARRDDAAERQVRPAALLEGRDARHLRRPALGARPPAATSTERAPGLPDPSAQRGPELGLLRVQPALGRGDQLHRALALAPTCVRRARARPTGSTAPAHSIELGDGTIARRTTSRSRRATATRCSAYAPDPTPRADARRAGRPPRRTASSTRRSTLPERGETRTDGRSTAGRDAAVPAPAAAGAPAGEPAPATASADEALRALALRRHVPARPRSSPPARRPPTTPSSAVERYLQRNFSYSEQPPARPYPAQRASCSRTSSATASSSRARWR